MKRQLKILGLGLAGILTFSAVNTRADLEVSASVQINAVADFEAPLATEGAWVDVGGYGHCWHPSHIEVGWRPYCTGEWVWTDSGWYWQSDEPWAWACYHYGSWTLDPTIGWCWVPGTAWAPAWVVWRSGGGYVGWAPCGPRGVVVAPELFGFVAVGHFSDPLRVGSLVVRNDAIIRSTVELRGPSRETRNVGGQARAVMINNGPGVDTIRQATGRDIKAVPVREADSRARVPETLTHRTAPATGAERPTPPLNQRTPERALPAPTRELNPTPPVNERPVPRTDGATPRREQIAPPTATRPPVNQNTPRVEDPATSRGIKPAPRNDTVPPKEEVTPRRQETAPPRATPPLNESRKQELAPPASDVKPAPPGVERAPRQEQVRPAPGRAPATVAPSHEKQPAEAPKGKDEEKREKP